MYEEDLMKCFSPTETEKTIHDQLDPSKAPGHDQIKAHMLQKLPQKCRVMLAKNFNTILRLHQFPRVWKMAEIIMLGTIPKPGKLLEDPKLIPTNLAPTHTQKAS